MNEGGLKALLKHSDLLAAVAVVVVAMMLVPLPSFLIDLFITINICAALMILITTMYVPQALDFSVFPSLLLITTLFRLGDQHLGHAARSCCTATPAASSTRSARSSSAATSSSASSCS